MIRQYELVERVREYNPDTDEALLNRAYVFGARAHAHQKRASGEPYFGHPLEVAAILTDLRLDDATIVTALLHDTVEDTAATSEELVRLFGSEIASLVDGVTKLNKLELSSKEAAQAENFRKLLLAMARDVRVLLVKLADRLHNMKTIGHLRLEKRQRIARETMEIYAPLAGRMGMQSIREQLEDLAFEVLNPEARTSIMRRFIKLRNERGDLIPYISADIFAAIAATGITAEVRGREKRPYSVWRKMEEKETSFSRLSDIYGFRIMCETEDECYRILGIVHRKWRMVPERFKDYISSPKSNGYRSIHTAVVSDEGQRIEIQIRTHEMHAVAETGVAAHWAFKDGIQAENRFAVDPFRWLHALADQVARGERDGEDEDGEHPEEFLERVKLDMFTDQVFCFTPKGDVIGLPRGATPVDFAYAIHTKVGNHCAGAMIDGRRAPLWTRLRNGQQVEVITAEGQAPSPHWEAMAQTGRAKSAIRRALRTRVLREQIALGRELLSDSFERAGRQPADKTFAVAAERLGQRSTDTMLAALARGELTSAQIIGAVYPTQMSEMRPDAEPAQGPVRRVRGLRRGLALSFCTGCWPIPGDRIVGLTRTGRVEVHAISCPYLEKFEDEMERWQNLSWDVEASALPNNLARINLILANEPGTLGRVCSLVGEQLANIDNLSMSERRPDFVSMQMDLEVRDVRHLSDILTALRAQTFVHSVERATGRDERQDATVDDGQARLPLPPGGRTVA